MKNQLLIATLAVGFLAGLGLAAVRGDFSRPAAAPVEVLPEEVAAVPQPAPATNATLPLPLQPVAPEAPVSEPQSDDRVSAASLPAPSFDDHTAARDRAAAHSARSR
jgi:hypothetical protein